MNVPRTLLSATLLLCIFSANAFAQEEKAGESAMDSPVTASLKGLHHMTGANIMSTAEMLDEEMYAYQPTEGVRTAGQILAHIATAQYFICSTAAGEDNPNGENFEETATTKADIVAALEVSFAYCDGVYDAMTDAQGAEARNIFGNDMAASGVLAFNSTHNYEHYGNLVTYMRMNGVVPPSSQQ